MIPEERRREIINFVRERVTTTISDISQTFKISEITVRRDLDRLSKEGFIRKVYGGVTIPNTLATEPIFLARINENIEEKRKIASEAIKRIEDGQTVLIESGTTCLELVKLLPQKKNLRVISTGPPLINALCSLKRQKLFDGEIICSGGIWREEPDIFIGPHAVEFFRHIRINVAFLGVVALNLEDGIMVSSQFEAELSKKIIACSKRVIALTDHTKFEKISFTKIGNLTLFDEIITDDGIDPKLLEKYRKARVNITVVS